MKIAILNECFLNDKHMARLQRLGRVKVFSNTTTANEAKVRLKDADVAIVDGFLAPLANEILSKAENLKLLVLAHTSFSMVDLESTKRQGIKVANAPGFSKRAVAELAIGLAFAVNRKIVVGDRAVRSNPMEADPGNPEHAEYFGFDFFGRTWGVVGLGRIGMEIAQMARGLGMNVIAFNRTPKTVEGVKLVDFEKLLKVSDVISISLALNKETEYLFAEHELDLMKQNAILINVAAAKHVNTEDLYRALEQKKIGGAGLDVAEGVKSGHPILALDNVVLTPHIGSFSRESFYANLPEIITSNIEAWAAGEPKNLVGE